MKYLGFVLVSFVFLMGCGSGTKSGSGCCSVPGINVVVVSPAGDAAIDDNGSLTLPITVQVTNDASNAGVTWALTPAVAGSNTGEALTALPPPSSSATYTPPAYSKLPKGTTWPLQATVTATSVTDPTRSAAIPITVNPPLQAATPSLYIANQAYLGLATAFLNTNYTCIGPGDTQIACQAGVLGGSINPSTQDSNPVTWSLGNSSLPPGLQLAPAQTTFPAPPAPAPQNTSWVAIVGTPALSGIYPFSLTATDATGNTVTQALTINVAPAQLKVVKPTVMEFVPNAPYAPIQLQASGGVPPYTWSVAPGLTLPSGLNLSSSGVISLSNSYTGLGNTAFAVQVTDSQSPVPAQGLFPAPSGGALINIAISDTDTPPTGYYCQTGSSDTALTPPGTTYAFVLSGFDTSGSNNVPVSLSGSFVVGTDSSGNPVVAGVEDVIPSNGVPQPEPLTGAISSDYISNHGCLTLSTASSPTAQFRFVPTALDPTSTYYTEGRIVEFDATGTRGSGYFYAQTPKAFATPAGTFAFRFSGWDASQNHFAMAGTVTAQGGSLTASADVNDGGSYSGPLTGSGTIGTPDPNTGRGTATLTVGATAYSLIYYIVDAHHLIFNSASGQPPITGEAIASAGPFSQATLSNSHIFRFGGIVPGSPDVAVGVLHFDGVGGVSGTNYERSGGTANATSISAEYVVDPATGRFSFSGTGIPVVGYAAVTSTSNITGYLVGTGASAASGTMEFQTNTFPPGYQIGPIIGNYGLGTEEMLDPQSTVIVGNENPARNGQLSSSSSPFVNYLYSSNLTGLTPFQEFDLFQYTWSADGSGAWGGNTYMVTNGSTYGSKFFYIDTSPLNGHPAVVVGQCWENCPPN